MGRVTFNGNVATAESQAFIRQAEQAIYQQRGKDEFKIAREVEFLYRENGLEPGTFYRAGTNGNAEYGRPQMSDYEPPRSYGIPGAGFLAGLIRSCIGWCIGFALVFFAIAWMNDFGKSTPEEDAAWIKYQAERCKAGNKNACTK